nr:DUF6128 domain-containing protein [uncultured Mediterraneibacter sp.]
MDTGTFYLYEYENNVRKRNAGFLKIYRRYQSCIFQAHIRSISLENVFEAEMYAFFFKENQICAKQIAHFPIDSMTHSIRFCAPQSSFPECRRLESIDGFFLKCSESSSLWLTPNCPENIDSDQIHFLDTDSTIQSDSYPASLSTRPDSPQNNSQEKANPLTKSESPDEAEPRAKDESPDETKPPAKDESPDEAEPRAKDESPDETKPPTKDESPDEPEPRAKSESNSSIRGEVRQNEISKTGLSLPRKLSLSDLTVLPRKFWFLSNNSFLLHGYHSYGHLLLTEQNGRLWLGVPGIYDLREARAADLFGFPRFCRSYADSDMLTDDERNANADFGHWFRCVGLRPR